MPRPTRFPPPEPPLRFRSIFISDVHLGSRRSRAERLLAFLRGTESDFLYVVGDLVDAWDPGGAASWPEAHAEVLGELRGRARNGTRVVYVPGNHDRAFAHSWCGATPPLSYRSETEHVTADGRRFLVVHGDGFDLLARRHPWLGRLGDGAAAWMERLAARLGPRAARSGFRLKQRLKRVLGYTGRFERSAARSARRRGVDGVICGHVHRPVGRRIDGVSYWNGGDWVESCTALVEHANGRLQLVGQAGEEAPRPLAAAG